MSIKKIISAGVSSDHELILLAQKLNIKLDAIYTMDEIKQPLTLGKNYILLLRKDDSVGHWVAVSDNYYFDAMGQGPPLKLNIKNYNRKQFQGTYSQYCGLWCLQFLYAKQNDCMDLFNKFIDLNDRTFE